MLKRTIAASTALSLVAGVSMADEMNVDYLSCANERNGEFSISHEHYDDPIIKIKGDVDIVDNISTQEIRGGGAVLGATKFNHSEKYHQYVSADGDIKIQEDFRGSIVPVSTTQTTELKADYNGDKCFITFTDTNRSDNNKTLVIPMAGQSPS